MTPIALYTVCEICEGHGRTSDRLGKPRTGLCFRCQGKGFLATEEGRTIIGLVESARVEGLLPEPGV